MTRVFPTSQNKETFKAHLRTYKNIFSSPILSARFEEISGVLNSYHNSLTATDYLNVILFDYGDTVDISNSMDLIYLPGLENDVINLQNGSTTKEVKILSNGVEVNSTTYGLGSAFVLGDRKFTVYGLGGALLNGETSPTYTLTPNTTAVNEGDTITFTLTTTNVPDGTTVNYAAFLDEVDVLDFYPFNSETGSVTVTNNTATFTIGINEDYSPQGVEGTENFIVNILDPSDDTVLASSPSIAITDSSFATYSIAGASSAVEGDTVTYTVTTTNVPDGIRLYWRFASDVTGYDVSAPTGNFLISNNTGTFSTTFLQDLRDDGNNLLTIELAADIQYNIIVASINTTVSDTPFTITLTPTATSVNESSATQDSTVVFNVQTTGIPDGQVLSARIAGGPELTFGGTGAVWTDTSGPPGIDGGDFPSQSGSSTINSDSGVLTVPINRDGRTEGDETFRIEIINSEGTVVATSPDIVINDTSYVGLNKDNRTFGPIHVTRDGGDANNTSDWYNICGLDAIPDNSKVAIFIDGSGSMTMNTVAASYQQLSDKLTERGITFITVTNSSEDWITPFDVELD